jgi:hypothetical protein
VSLSSLTTSELEAMLWRRIAELDRLRTEIQRRRGTESIEGLISCLPNKKRAFLLALWNTPHKRMKLTDLAKIVWKETDDIKTQVQPETIRKFVQRLEASMEESKIPLFLDCVKRENGDVYGYKLTLKK